MNQVHCGERIEVTSTGIFPITYIIILYHDKINDLDSFLLFFSIFSVLIYLELWTLALLKSFIVKTPLKVIIRIPACNELSNQFNKSRDSLHLLVIFHSINAKWRCLSLGKATSLACHTVRNKHHNLRKWGQLVVLKQSLFVNQVSFYFEIFVFYLQWVE